MSKVVFRGGGSFQQADLEAVAQMHSGDKVTIDQIRGAAQRLIDTGFFDDVSVDSDHKPSALTVIFILKQLPADQITKVGFENFVWFTPEELRSVVHKVVPLFNGDLPESGASLEQIDAALQAALTAKGVTGAVVEHQAVLATSAVPVHSLEFRVANPLVLVNSVRVEGVDPALAADVNRIVTRLRGSAYADGDSDFTTMGRLLAPYRDAGYLEARLEDLKVAVLSGAKVGVDVSAKVIPGETYRVKTIQIAETPLVPAVSFAAQSDLRAGDVASRKELLATLAPIDEVYHKQGYADEYVNTVVSRDEATHTVSYALTVVPGEQYRVRSVNVMGLTPEARAQFDKGWNLKPGELYDPGYVRSFLTNKTGVQGLAGYAGGFKAASDPQTHLVDLMITFVSTSGKG